MTLYQLATRLATNTSILRTRQQDIARDETHGNGSRAAGEAARLADLEKRVAKIEEAIA